MSCEHSETTAVLAAFGEAPESFESHLAACPECRTVVAEHLETLSLIEPAVSEIKPTPSRGINRYAAGFLIAAGMLLAAQFEKPPQQAQEHTAHHARAFADIDITFDDDIDQQLASLELEVALFNLEES